MPLPNTYTTFYRVPSFRFQVTIYDASGNAVSIGLSKISGLKDSSEVIEYREGNEPAVKHKQPGLSSADNLTLERAISHKEEDQYDHKRGERHHQRDQDPFECAAKPAAQDVRHGSMRPLAPEQGYCVGYGSRLICRRPPPGRREGFMAAPGSVWR